VADGETTAGGEDEGDREEGKVCDGRLTLALTRVVSECIPLHSNASV